MEGVVTTSVSSLETFRQAFGAQRDLAWLSTADGA